MEVKIPIISVQIDYGYAVVDGDSPSVPDALEKYNRGEGIPEFRIGDCERFNIFLTEQVTIDTLKQIAEGIRDYLVNP